MKITYNVPALRANRFLSASNNAVDKSIEKLSSGYKINKAVDDSAGMAISRKMKTQIEGLEQASRNGGDGISVLQTAEGTVAEVTSMIQRMRELAVQAANDTYTMDDRKKIQDEVNQLSEQIYMFSEQTEYNTKTLLNGSLERVSYADAPNVEILSSSDIVTAQEYDFSISEYGTKAETQITLPSGNMPAGTIEINGESVTIGAGEDAESAFEKIRDLCECVNIELNEEGEMKTVLAGSDQRITITCSAGLADALGIETTVVSEAGTDAVVELGEGFPPTASATVKGNQVSITDYSGYEMLLDLKPDVEEGSEEVKLTIEDGGPLVVQIGANQKQEIEISIPKVTPKTLGIDKINLRSADGANQAIIALDEALNRINAIRSKIGAYQNRMETAISSLDESSEDVTRAMSRVEDVDMATEMTNYTSKTILAQAGTSMVAQVNSRPQSVLSMLQM